MKYQLLDIKTIILIATLGVVFVLSLLYRSSLKFESCKNPTQLEDYSDRKKRFLICKDSVYYGKTLVTNKKQYPQIFGYKFKDKETWDTQLEIVIYSIDKKEFIAIFPVINAYTWYTRAGYIFVKKDNVYNLVFEKKFENLSGRWTGVRFDENGSIFDPNTIVINQDLGFIGALGQVIRWSDYYEWNNTKEAYVLANIKNINKFEDHKEEYEKQNESLCGHELSSLSGDSISDLYPERKDKVHFCYDQSEIPFISGEQATLFMKARQAIDEVISGKNISIDDIEKVQLKFK